MNDKQVRELIQRELDGVWNSRDAHRYRETSHAHRVTHESNVGDMVGHDRHVEIAQAVHNAFTNYHVKIDHVIVEGNMAAARLTYTGKHTGDFMGFKASGKEIKVIEHSFFRIEGDKIAEKWNLWDSLSLLQQIGALPKQFKEA